MSCRRRLWRVIKTRRAADARGENSFCTSASRGRSPHDCGAPLTRPAPVVHDLYSGRNSSKSLSATPFDTKAGAQLRSRRSARPVASHARGNTHPRGTAHSCASDSAAGGAPGGTAAEMPRDLLGESHIEHRDSLDPFLALGAGIDHVGPCASSTSPSGLAFSLFPGVASTVC